MNDAQLLERLSSAYATVEAPPPSAGLAALMDAGGVRDDDQAHDAVVVPFARPRTRVRMRYLVAAMVATFMLFSGLAVAGALPDPLQRQVSQVVSHLGIDLPHPSADDHGGSAPPSEHGTEHGTPSSTAPASSPGGDAVAPGAGAGAGATGSTGGASAPGNPAGSIPGTPPTTAPTGSVLGGVGDILGGGSTPTTLPPSDGSGGVLPPLTVPQLTLPPLTVPPLTVPQLTVPPLTVTPLTIPPLPLGL